MSSASNDLFRIIKLDHANNSVNATLGIYEESEIFKGHFPGLPVVPGACMLQIVKDVLESTLDGQIQLIKADQLKFLNMIEPTKYHEIQLSINYTFTEADTINATAKLIDNGVVCFKFQGSFIRN
ncbi:MAG: hypothetical protein ACXVAU_04040 [Mucilaginibacter sp.]